MKVPGVLGIVLVLVSLLLPTTVSDPKDNLTAAASRDPLRALISRQSNLDLFYLDWQKRYLSRGGDRSIEISVAWTDSLSTEPSPAHGRVFLDLIEGAVRAEVRGLEGRPADLWLVDNREGPGRTVRPEPGDRMLRIGRLQTQGGAGTVSTLGTGLAPELFQDFEIDLAVVAPAGRTPAESTLLVGTRPFFERLYTRTRVATEAARARDARLLGPASLLAALSPRAAEADFQVLIDHGLVSQAAGEGADLFFRGTFGGNGRTCGTCHRVENNLGLDVGFISRLPARDKLFIAEHRPSDGGVPGLERPLLLRRHGQILMNSDGFEDLSGKFVMRAAQPVLSLATSTRSPDGQVPPVQRTGWGGDAAPGNGALRLLPNGAMKQHFTRSLDRVEGVDFFLPTDAELDSLEAFMLSSGRLNELDLFNVQLTHAAAQAGKERFQAFCNRCHFNAGATLGGNFNFNFVTGVERAPDPSQATEPHPRDGGFGTNRLDCDGDGGLDCFGNRSFNVPPLIEAADTEPFFHNHSAATIEDAVSFYTTDAFVDGALPLSRTDVLNVAAFLRVLNASFNSAISIQRNTAALTLESNGASRETVNMLLALSSSEAADAVEVLSRQRLHPKSVKLLIEAISMNGRAIKARTASGRQTLIRRALDSLKAAKGQLGTGLEYQLGEGNLLF